MHGRELSGAFKDPTTEAASVFRQIMTVLARPGTISEVKGAHPPAPLSAAAGAAVLTLCDTTTPLYLAGRVDCGAVRSWITFHTGAPFAGPSEAMFALGAWDALQPTEEFDAGTPEYPDRSATLIVELTQLTEDGARLEGPGIQDIASLSLPETAAFQRNNALFPLGLDFLFTCGSKIAALPRSTEVQ